MYETLCPTVIFLAVKLHDDIPKPHTVIECNRIALQTALVYVLQRPVTPLKSSECSPNVIFLAVKLHDDIPKPHTVIECNRIALQTALVYVLQRPVTPLKSSECNLQIICASPHHSLSIYKVSASHWIKAVGGVIRKQTC